ncbi:protein phosphatase 1 regulatory subunit 36-like isoform X1 [Leguminivora glycinivorella]|uniref:protein phosphatase 1 regulatory subunit 36-like isoform X1 n=1 Tax=Leguminivora glycinivorella TaxID=1035111 RepID=UPI00200C4B7D|nr:protein phosphatase 1 regulatory subunit 36-like isoform X1 [Leguminivora glycinivorella]
MADDEDEGEGGLYEEGHWIWDENANQIAFVSDRPVVEDEAIAMPTKMPTGAIEFRDDVDLIEQLRYRRRYQRKLKPEQPDVITVQDCKDIALYTAPVSILSPALINMLHIPTTERFMKALILCCQYYLQVSDEMGHRMMELETRVRTPYCDVVEQEFGTNLNDLRALAAKEYCTMLIGGADTKKYHHMGPAKKRRSLSDKDARLFETMLRMCVQIVWLALGRKAFNQIELEVNRLFKSEIFNAVEHTLKTNYVEKMTKEERNVLLGQCLRTEKKLTTKSPMMNEVFCYRDIDYRMMGIGVIKMNQMPLRLKYIYNIVAGPEEKYSTLGVSLGIVGMPRTSFDTMLKPLPTAEDAKSKKSLGSMSSGSAKSNSSLKKSGMGCGQRKLYADIHLPLKSEHDDAFPPSFPSEPEAPTPCNDVQRRRWLKRLQRLRRGQRASAGKRN